LNRVIWIYVDQVMVDLPEAVWEAMVRGQIVKIRILEGLAGQWWRFAEHESCRARNYPSQMG